MLRLIRVVAPALDRSCSVDEACGRLLNHKISSSMDRTFRAHQMVLYTHKLGNIDNNCNSKRDGRV